MKEDSVVQANVKYLFSSFTFIVSLANTEMQKQRWTWKKVEKICEVSWPLARENFCFLKITSPRGNFTIKFRIN